MAATSLVWWKSLLLSQKVAGDDDYDDSGEGNWEKKGAQSIIHWVGLGTP